MGSKTDLYLLDPSELPAAHYA